MMVTDVLMQPHNQKYFLFYNLLGFLNRETENPVFCDMSPLRAS